MKRVYIITTLTCAVLLAAMLCGFRMLNLNGGREHLTVGFIYDNDESTPYTYNFSLAKDGRGFSRFNRGQWALHG